MTDFIIEDLLDNEFSLTAPDAVERSTGWRDCYCIDLSTGSVEFFDAEQNERFPVSPVRDLDVAIRNLEDAIADESRGDDWTLEDKYPVQLTFSNTGCR